MSETYHLTYGPNQRVIYEAMRLAGATVFTGWRRGVIWAQLLVLGVLAPIGAMGLFLLIQFQFTDQMRFEPVWLLPLVYLLGGILALSLAQVSYLILAQASTGSRFASGSTAEIGPEGVIVTGPNSRWQTHWADIEAVTKGKRVIAVVTGAVALPIPIAAFESAEAAGVAFKQMQAWHAVAGGGS